MTLQLSNWIKKHSLVAYFVLAFLITWILILPLALSAQNLLHFRISEHWHFLGALGPIGAAFIVTAIADVKAGISEFLERMARWKVGIVWFLVSAFSPFVLFLLSMLILRIFGNSWPDFGKLASSEYATLAWVGGSLLSAVAYGIGEEAGWRGFALPRLQQRRSALWATFILSVFWAIWHIPMFFYRFEFGIGQVIGFFIGLFAGAIWLTFLYKSRCGIEQKVVNLGIPIGQEAKHMITFEDLSKRPSTFKSFTGVSVVEFEELLAQVRPLWAERERERLARPQRKRAIGGGRKPALALREQLLLTLVWLRLYLTTEALGYLFGIDKATVSRYTRRMLPVLRAIGEATLGWPEPPKRGKSLEEVQEEHPDLFAFVDATEQPVRRSQDKETQKRHYSGKRKRHTRKVQVIVNEEGLVRDVSESVSGSVHDRKLFTRSEAASKIPKDVVVGGNAGYQGIQNDLPEHSVVTPFKQPKHHPLNEEQKQLNQAFARSRIIVENTIGAFKHFKVLAEVFRHAIVLWDDVFRAVLAIVNPRIQKRIRQASVA